MIETIVSEMVKGNFSFAILIVGLIQVALMWKNGKVNIEGMISVRVKRLSDTAVVPTMGSMGAAGFDLYADIQSPVVIPHNSTRMMQTNIAVEIPRGYFGAVFARSGLSTKHYVRPANCVGVIDSDYRGSIGVPLHNDSYTTPYVVHPKERVAQLVIIPTPWVTLAEVDELSDTERGDNGFGSTGKE